MLKKVSFCECYCNGCGEQFMEGHAYPLPFDLPDSFEEKGWHEIDDNTHYCPACYAKLKGEEYDPLDYLPELE